MSDVRALIADMVKAGVDPELIGRTAEALAQREAVLVPDEAADRRRAKDRERKRLRKSAENPDPSFSPEVSPAPLPNPSIINPPSPPKGGSSPAEFSAFWDLYPNKVGKSDASKAFARARGRVDFVGLMAGLRRYVDKTDDRPWCNPATWLNQDRWHDQPASAPPARGSPPNRPPTKTDVISNLRESLRNEPQPDRRDFGPDGDHGLLIPFAGRSG